MEWSLNRTKTFIRSAGVAYATTKGDYILDKSDFLSALKKKGDLGVGLMNRTQRKGATTRKKAKKASRKLAAVKKAKAKKGG